MFRVRDGRDVDLAVGCFSGRRLGDLEHRKLGEQGVESVSLRVVDADDDLAVAVLDVRRIVGGDGDEDWRLAPGPTVGRDGLGDPGPTLDCALTVGCHDHTEEGQR